jgi:hypothetical protein
MPKPRTGAKKTAQIPFSRKLALHQWALSLFGVQRFEDLALHLRDEGLEGFDENNISRFHHALLTHFPDLPKLPPALLLEYDQNIFRHTAALNERRIAHGEKPIVWKYFQYLALLFTEIYLDRYFSNPEKLRADIAAQIERINQDKEEADQIQGFENAADAAQDLNKLAFWMATGSGKTLLMHANILQYRFYVEKHRRQKELNRIILLTPNEGLSEQHLREFQASGIEAEIFNKDGSSLFTGHSVEIIEITKLKEEMGDKTVAVDAFEGNNLVLIDEGHRGVGRGEEGAWMRYRNALCEKGFSFEYSATFAQAVKGNPELTSLYARSILFDYSYRYFYNDGFGKDYQILNLDNDTQQNHLELYLTACLLTFFQQQKLYKSNESSFRAFHIEKPLWIFVGSKVTATLAAKDASDIVEILLFLKRFVANGNNQSIQHIERVLTQGLVTADGKNLFANRFVFLNTCGLQASDLFYEILTTLFHASAGGQLYVENLKGAAGELALKIGADNEPFGLINVGDDAKLLKLCEQNGIETGEREFSGSLFHGINKNDSTVNILIGSKKFTEGWSSWRVSTMGLMNIGATEGAQIIQLFGRGVRLKGFNFSLKRSNRVTLPEGITRPKYIEVLETLSIFGIHADYMAQFRDFLEEEGLPADTERLEFFLPVIRNLGTQPLKIIRLKKQINGITTEFGDAFRKLAPIPTLDLPTEYLQKNQVVLNWYPKIQAIKSRGLTGEENAAPYRAHLQPRHIAFLDMDQIYFEIERYKAERGWYNLNITRQAMQKLLLDQSWYQLYIPENELDLDRFEKIYEWQEIAIALLKKYVERYYSYKKREWEMPHLEYCDVNANDPNLLLHESPEGGGYRILLEESQEEIIEKLNELKALIESGNLKNWEFRGIKAIWFGKHLYQPLLYLEHGFVEISPVPLNRGEKDFVEDLKTFCDQNAKYLAEKELYLLRNLSKGKGVGFFEAGNFYPDFILWVLVQDKQYVTFIDPKGLRNIGFQDPKVQFYQTIKDIEQRLGNPQVILNSFIISNTPSNEITRLWGISKEEILAKHIVFQEEDKGTYIRQILKNSWGRFATNRFT